MKRLLIHVTMALATITCFEKLTGETVCRDDRTYHYYDVREKGGGRYEIDPKPTFRRVYPDREDRHEHGRGGHRHDR